MILDYPEIKSHNYVVDLYWPRCYLTCCPYIVLHEEPKYEVASNHFMYVIFVQFWHLPSHNYMVLHHTSFQYTGKYINCPLQLWYQYDNPTQSNIHNLVCPWWIPFFWYNVKLSWFHLLNWLFDGLSTTDIQTIKPYSI